MVRKTNPVLRRAMRVALYAGITSATLAVATPVLAAEDGDNNKEAEEEVVVTGSRIKRAELNQSKDLVTMDAAQIEATGDLMIADVLRGSPLNSYGSFSERSGSSAQSNATIDLRGLGDERTLVLINGRRIPGSPNLGAAAVNINMIPMAAVERIDTLPNSASAVYGSDAEAGVVNIILKKDFEGFEINARYGDRSQDDGVEQGASLVGGASNDKGNVTYAIEWNKRDAIMDADRPYTSAWMNDANGDGRIDIYAETGGISYYGKTVELWDPVTGYYDLRAANGCPTTDGFVGELGAAALVGDPSMSVCGYAYANVSANKAALDRFNTYIDGSYQLADNVEFFTSAIFSRVESWGRYAPPAAGWPGMSPDYADVPWDIDAMMADGTISDQYELYGYYRWTNIGPRDNTVIDTQYDVTGGFRGDINDKLSYEVYAQYDRYDSNETGTYYLSYPGLDTVLQQGIDPFSPEGQGLMRATTSQDNYTTMAKFYGQLQWTVGDLTGAGDTIVLGGAEHFKVDYQNLFDAASEAGLVGGSAGNSSSGDRDVTAFFAEAIVPLPMNLELDAAVRYDDYSDFGSEVSPSLGLKWQATDTISARVHWGQGFRAPALSDLYGPLTYSAEYGTDYATCFSNGTAPENCPERQYDTYISSNEDLEAETSQSWNVGGNWEFVDNWSVDLSWWDIEIDDVISTVDIQSVLNAEAAGIVLDPATGIWVDRSGGLPVIHTGSANNGQLNVDGMDFQLNGMIETGFGTLTPSFVASWTHSYEQQVYYGGPVQETAGFNLQPEWRWQFIMGWNLGNHYVDMAVNYIGEHSEADWVEFDSSGRATLVTSDTNLDAWTTLDLSYKYDTGKYGAFKIGARNLTDEDPVLDRNGLYSDGHNDLYDNTGRVVYVEYSLKY